MVYTPPEYPAAIPDQITDLPDQTDDIDWIEAWIYNYVKKELIAVMTELGTDPAGTEATVAARLTAIEAAGVDESVILNIYLNSFRIAILGSYAVMNMVKGISDEYEDETGVDTTASTNEDYDSDNDLYEPTRASVVELDYMEYASDALAQAAYVSDDADGYSDDLTVPAGTITNSGNEIGGREAEFAFDNDGDTRYGVTTDNEWVTYDFGDGNAKVITRYTITSSPEPNSPKDWNLQGSNNNSDWDTLDTKAGQDITDGVKRTHDIANTTAYRYIKWNGTARQGGGAAGWNVDELEYMEDAANLQCYSEDTIKEQGSYSLKTIAVITDSLNDTLTRTLDPVIDLSDIDTLTFEIRASRTGEQIKIGIHDAGGTTTEHTVDIDTADVFQTESIDLSAVTNANKDGIDSIIITIINADAENTFYIDDFHSSAVIHNMTLVSELFTADAESDDARIVIFEEDVDAITLNTDLKAYVSRDDGTTWTQITLTDEGDYSGSKRILTGTADISEQPSGTDMVYKITSLNNKDLKLYGSALSWA